MNRVVVVLCLLSRVIAHNIISYKQTRIPRLDSLPSENGYVFNQVGDTSGMYAMFANEDIKHKPYASLEPFEFKSSDKLGVDAPHYSDLSSLPDAITDRTPSHTMIPTKYENARIRNDVDYEISKAKSDAKYASMTNKYTPSKIKSDIMIENLKSMMHYDPPEHVLKENTFSSYEIHNDYHNDDDDVRSSGRTMYDSYWPRIYHSPYEYEYKKGISDIEKAKDKRYVDASLEVKPVHEHIENDSPHSYSDDHNVDVSTDNPIVGDGPFFSFVLNDYFDRNNEEDPLSFKGLDVAWGKEFDHESYRPSIEDIIHSKRDRRLKDAYTGYSGYTGTPGTRWITTTTPTNYHSTSTGTVDRKRSPITVTPFTSTLSYLPSHQPLHGFLPDVPPSHKYHASEGNSLKEEGTKKHYDADKHDLGKSSYADHKAGYDSNGHKYEGFRDFLDSFANKFGSEEHKKDANYEKENNEDKGQKKKGFHRVYHKDEFQEDNEFYDNSNTKSKEQEKGKSKLHVGGSEAFLRSQALANMNNAINTARKAGNIGDGNYENVHHTHDGASSKGNKFVKFIDVAKEAAKSNSADYLDHFRA